MPSMIPGDQDSCHYCTVQASSMESANEIEIGLREKLKKEHKAVYSGGSIKLKSRHVYYLISID